MLALVYDRLSWFDVLSIMFMFVFMFMFMLIFVLILYVYVLDVHYVLCFVLLYVW